MNNTLATIRGAYESSVLYRFLAFWKRKWHESNVYALLLWIIQIPSLDDGSCIRKKLDAFNLRLSKMDRLNTTINDSCLYRIWSSICKTGRESRLLGWVFREGFTGFLLLLLALYTPIDYLLRDVFSIPVISSGWDEGFLILAFLWLFIQRIRQKPARLSSSSPLDLPVFFFLAICLALLIYGLRLVDINVAGFRATAQYILWFFIATRMIQSERQCKILYYVMVVIAGMIALHGIYQFIVAAPIPEHWTDHAEAAVRTRVYSIFGSPNIMGDFMVMFAPMTAALAYILKNKYAKLGCWFLTFTMCFSCLFTMSRGAWIALVIAILIFSVLVDRRLLLLMGIAFVFALFLPFVANRIGYLFTSEYAASSARGGRSVRWEQTLVYLKQFSPTFGIGFGMFGGAVAMQNKVSDWMTYFYTDNYYVKILAENGYVGLVSFIIMMLGVLWTGIRAWFRQRKTPLAPMCAGLLAGLSGVLVHCFFENIFEEPYMGVCFWTIAAMLMYLGYIRDRAKLQLQ